MLKYLRNKLPTINNTIVKKINNKGTTRRTSLKPIKVTRSIASPLTPVQIIQANSGASGYQATATKINNYKLPTLAQIEKATNLNSAAQIATIQTAARPSSAGSMTRRRNRRNRRGGISRRRN